MLSCNATAPPAKPQQIEEQKKTSPRTLVPCLKSEMLHYTFQHVCACLLLPFQRIWDSFPMFPNIWNPVPRSKHDRE